MTFLDYLDQLRARPEAERRRLVWWSSILLTLLVALLWFWNLGVVNEPAAAPPSGGVNWSEKIGGVITRIKLGWQTLIN